MKVHLIVHYHPEDHRAEADQEVTRLLFFCQYVNCVHVMQWQQMAKTHVATLPRGSSSGYSGLSSEAG